MRCIVVLNLETDKVDFFWWCGGLEYVRMKRNLELLYPKPKWEISTEYERSSYNVDNALGY